MSLLPECPRAPDWRIDWDRIERAYAWLDPLRGCSQEPEHHAEGDVWTHTRLACETLVATAAWRALPESERAVLFAATLLHDIGKPAATRRESDGRISSRGHSGRGEIMARRILWRLGAPFCLREQVATLVRHHQKPFYLVDHPDSRRLAIEISQTARCDHLAILAEADARGRSCADLARLLDNVLLFAERCRELDCLERPYPFASDHSRFSYFRTHGRDPAYPAYDDTRCEALLMSGLPAAGKDHWIAANLPNVPIISLDDIRRELSISPTDPQGAVVAVARERARANLRVGRSFIWNGTNVSRDLRARVVRLLADYNARVRIVYVEVSEPRLLHQNRQRRDPVPEQIIEKLLGRWQVPDLSEAHQVEWVVADSELGEIMADHAQRGQ